MALRPTKRDLNTLTPRREPLNTPALPSRPTNNPRRLSAGRIVLLVVIVALGAFFLGRQDWGNSSLNSTNDVNGSGVAATQTRTLPPFTRIDLAGGSAVTVHVGAKQAVVVRADDNLINHIETDVQDGALVVSERGNFATDLPLSVEVTVPNLERTRLIGSGMISVEGVHARTFTAEVPGSGTLTISGTVDQLDATLAGSGDMQLGHLAARSVTASVLGSGRLEVQAIQTLDASVSGSGAIVYSGHPTTLEQSVSGSGAIRSR